MSELNSHIAWSCQEPSAIPLPGRGCRPHLHRAVPTARGNVPAVGRPGQRTHLIGVSFVDEEKATLVSIQDVHRAVSVPGSDVASIRGPGQRPYDASCISGVLEKLFSCFYVPDLHRVVPVSRGNVLAVGRPGDRVHKFGMSGVGAQGLSGAGVPDLDGMIPTAGGDELSIGGPHQRTHHIVMSGVESLQQEKNKQGVCPWENLRICNKTGKPGSCSLFSCSMRR
jgi:hypothetical protein